MDLLHESRLEVAGVHGKLRFVQESPEISPEPVVAPDTVADGTGVSIYGSVVKDGGLFRMWYQAWPRDWDGKDAGHVGYAESDDGLTWRKPGLGLVQIDGAETSLCDLNFHSPSVYLDEDAEGAHRYRATGYVRPGRAGSHDVERAGYYTARSKDGLHWELDADSPVWEGGDVITSAYHPHRHSALVSLKRNVRAGGIPRRSI